MVGQREGAPAATEGANPAGALTVLNGLLYENIVVDVPLSFAYIEPSCCVPCWYRQAGSAATRGAQAEGSSRPGQTSLPCMSMNRAATLLNVVDVEATCWQDGPPDGQVSEIIEIGLTTVDLSLGQRIGRHRILVRPQRSAVSAFCTELTGLTQAEVDARDQLRRRVPEVGFRPSGRVQAVVQLG